MSICKNVLVVVLEEDENEDEESISWSSCRFQVNERETNLAGCDHISRNTSRAYCRRLNCAWIMAESFRICTMPSSTD